MRFSTFSTGFSTTKGISPIRTVIQAAAFWKVLDENAGILPFIKKKVEGFSFVFTVYSGLRVCFSPIWNLTPGSFPQTAGEKNPVWKTDTNCGFPHCFCPAGAAGELPLPSCRFASSHLPQGDGFSSGGKVSGIAQRRHLGGAGCERSEQTEGVFR